MKRSIRIGLVALISSFQVAAAQTQSQKSNFVFKDSSSSYVTILRDTIDANEQVDQISTTSSYHLASEWQGDKNHFILIHETNIEHMNSTMEGAVGKIVLHAFSGADNFQKEIWKKTIDANSAEYVYDYLQVTTYGCCGADNGRKLYRYGDGKKLMELSSELGTVEVPNQHSKRYIGALSTNAALPVPGLDTQKAYVALLTYIDPNSMKKQEAVIHSKHRRDSTSFDIPYLTGLTFTPLEKRDSTSYGGRNGLTLWSATRANDYSNFTIDLTFELDDTTILHIPVRNDKLDLAAVRSDWFDVEPR
jgi:hypothetical protein